MTGPEETAIRCGRAGDGEGMSRVFLAAGRRAWTHFLPEQELAAASPPAEHWERQVAGEDGALALVAELEGEVVAFAVIRPSQDADAAGAGEIDTFYASPRVWGSGVARALLDNALQLLRGRGVGEATLWTAEQNARARSFYESAGWRPDGARRPKRFAGVDFAELRYRIPLERS